MRDWISNVTTSFIRFVESVNLTGRNLLELTVLIRMIDEEYDVYKLSYTKIFERKLFGHKMYRIIEIRIRSNSKISTVVAINNSC